MMRKRYIKVPRPENPPGTKPEFEAWVWKLANHVLNRVDERREGNRELETLVKMINDLPTAWVVVDKFDHNEGTWSFSTVPRLAARVPILGKLQ